MDKESAVLQGSFLLANKLCLPTSLSSLQKGDWSKVAHPILKAVQEICHQVELGDSLSTSAVHWRKKITCVLWLKLLERDTGEDRERGWRENPFFSVQNGLPDINRVVLLELLKSMGAARIFSQLLLRLPQAQICTELGRLAQHVASSPTSEDDVRFFLQVWWEMWRGEAEGKAGGEDKLEKMFADQFARLSSQPPPSSSSSVSMSSQAAKRFKSDPDTSDLLPVSSSAYSSTTDVLSILLHALKDIRDHVSTPDLCYQALSVSLDALYTSFLIDQAVPLPPEQKMHCLSKVVSIRERNGEKFSPALLQDAQRDLCTSHTPSQFRPCLVTLAQALQILTELTQFWQERGLLEMSDSLYPSCSVLHLDGSIQRTFKALEDVEAPETTFKALEDVEVSETMSEVDDPQRTLTDTKNTLREMLGSLSFPNIESNPEVNARVTMAIINHRLEDYQDFAVLFATEVTWAMSDKHWMDCLERNKAAFQQHGTVMKLVSTLIAKSHTDITQCRKLTKIIVDIFAELSLADKNIVLTAMLRFSSKGLLEGSLPGAATDGFGQELNMAFNCIIQGGGGASAAVSHSNLSLAISLVARVAFQNPEATLRRCCHSAVFNKGAFSLMAKILQQLPGLRGRVRKDEAGRRGDATGSEKNGEKILEEMAEGCRDGAGDRSLLCSCLQETIMTKQLSADERRQFLRFLVLLMVPIIEAEGEERKQSFLSLQEVVCTFVLPHLSTTQPGPISLDLSLQLLNGALSLDVQEPASSPHWVLDCSPFPLLYTLAQLLNQASRCWDQPPEGTVNFSMETKELLVSVLTTLAEVVGQEVASAPSTWSRALYWLYNKVAKLDWIVRFHLKPVWGEHFKNEVPSSLLTVCDLPEQEWSGLELPNYGQGTGLLAWMECCSISDHLRSTMLSCLSLDQRRPDHLNMFGKGLMVAVTQTLPWCSLPEWTRLLGTLRELLQSGRLHVPYSLEYVDYLPLLDLRGFSSELRLSVLLLRVLQLLCGSSCSDWLPVQGWAHVGLLYAHAVREMLESLRVKLALSSSSTSTVSPKTSATSTASPQSPKTLMSGVSSLMSALPKPSKTSKKQMKDIKKEKEEVPHVTSVTTPQAAEALPKTPDVSITTPSVDPQKEEEQVGTVPCQEVLFVLSQLFCHVQHAQVMMPGGQCEVLFLCSLEVLSHYETIMAAYPDSSTHLESDNTRHFFTTITDNLENKEMKAVLQQKIAQLKLSVA